MLILTEAMFAQIMFNYSPLLFSREALKLIYEYCRQQDTEPTEFYEMDVEISFTEESFFDCVEDNNIAVADLTKADSEKQKIEITKSAISDFLGGKTNVLGFTSHHTVVYAKNY